MPRENKILKVGDRAPPFVLRSSEGQEIRLSDMRGPKVVVLVFFRGTW